MILIITILWLSLQFRWATALWRSRCTNPLLVSLPLVHKQKWKIIQPVWGLHVVRTSNSPAIDGLRLFCLYFEFLGQKPRRQVWWHGRINVSYGPVQSQQSEKAAWTRIKALAVLIKSVLIFNQNILKRQATPPRPVCIVKDFQLLQFHTHHANTSYVQYMWVLCRHSHIENKAVLFLLELIYFYFPPSNSNWNLPIGAKNTIFNPIFLTI